MRISLNSFGPLISLCLRSWRSSSVDDGSIRRSISRAANSDAFAALFARDPLRCVVSSPNSTSRKMASGRVGLSLCLAAQASTRLRSSDESGMVSLRHHARQCDGLSLYAQPCASLSFHLLIYRPSSHLQSRERKTAVIRGQPGAGCHMSWTKIRPGMRGREQVMKVGLWPVSGTPACGCHRGHCGDAGG